MADRLGKGAEKSDKDICNLRVVSKIQGFEIFCKRCEKELTESIHIGNAQSTVVDGNFLDHRADTLAKRMEEDSQGCSSKCAIVGKDEGTEVG